MKRYIKIHNRYFPTDASIPTVPEGSAPRSRYTIHFTGYYPHPLHTMAGESNLLAEAKQICCALGWIAESGEPIGFVLEHTPNGPYKVYAPRWIDALTLKHLARTDWEQVRRDDKTAGGAWVNKGVVERGNILINF